MSSDTTIFILGYSHSFTLGWKHWCDYRIKAENLLWKTELEQRVQADSLQSPQVRHSFLRPLGASLERYKLLLKWTALGHTSSAAVVSILFRHRTSSWGKLDISGTTTSAWLASNIWQSAITLNPLTLVRKDGISHTAYIFKKSLVYRADL